MFLVALFSIHYLHTPGLRLAHVLLMVPAGALGTAPKLLQCVSSLSDIHILELITFEQSIRWPEFFLSRLVIGVLVSTQRALATESFLLL